MQNERSREMTNEPAQGLTQPLLKSREVAALLGIAPRTLWLMRSQGRGPRAIRLGPGSLRFRAEDVADWIRAQQEDDPSEP